MPVGARIFEHRKALGLSLEGLAKRLQPYWPNISRSYVRKIEQGERRIPSDMLRFFAKALECPVEDLSDPPPED